MSELRPTNKEIWDAIDRCINNRNKILVLWCKDQCLPEVIQSLDNAGISATNLGQRLAMKLESKIESRHLHLEAQAALMSVVEETSVLIDPSPVNLLCIYNIGILFEPDFGFEESQSLRSISKSTAIVLIWEHEMDLNGHLWWGEDPTVQRLDLSEASIQVLKLTR